MAKNAPLRLLAQDADDLAIISSAMQDAVAKVGDVTYEAKQRRLTIAFNRYCWEAGGNVRVRSALQLGGVMKVQTRRIRRGAKDAVIEVLAVAFDEGDSPGGMVTIRYARFIRCNIETPFLFKYAIIEEFRSEFKSIRGLRPRESVSEILSKRLQHRIRIFI